MACVLSTGRHGCHLIGGLAGTDFGASVVYVSSLGFTPGDTPLTTANISDVDHIGDYVYANGFTDSNPYAAEWDHDGNMYVADAGANAIVRVDAVTGEYSIFATFPDFPNPLPVGPPFINVVPTDILAAPDDSVYQIQAVARHARLETTQKYLHTQQSKLTSEAAVLVDAAANGHVGKALAKRAKPCRK